MFEESTSTAGSVRPVSLSTGGDSVQGYALVDFDNFFPGALGSTEQLQQNLARIVDLVLGLRPDTSDISIRLYGGWLEAEMLTQRASELQMLVGPPASAAPHPTRPGLLRVEVVLATRLIGAPGLEWGHTFRSQAGLPRLRLAQSPRPTACVGGDTCPVDLVQRMSRSPQRECHVPGCTVSNETAFLVKEQKMVDALLTCDCLSLSDVADVLVVMSHDLDALPGIALAASNPTSDRCKIALVRRSDKPESLYRQPLENLGVTELTWEPT
jgi:hypothetical protein